MRGNGNDSDGSDYDVEDFFGHRAPVASRAAPIPKEAAAPKFAPAPPRSNQSHQGYRNAYGSNNSNNRQQSQQSQFGQHGRNAHPWQDSRVNAQPARRQQQQQQQRQRQRDQPSMQEEDQDQDDNESEESSASGSESDDDDAAQPSSSKSSAPAPAPTPAVADTRTFSDLGVHPTLIHHLANRMNITAPTPIQRAVYSTLLTNPKLSHRDVAIQSETGSGKTLSFLLPIIQSLLFPDPEPTEQPARTLGPLCLVLAPTRELAQQIHGVLEQLTNISRSGGAGGHAAGEEGEETTSTDDKQQDKLFVPRHWLVSGTIVGGDSKKSEKARIRKGINIIVSTPGRFLDHLRTTRNLDATRIRWIVLDEADRLLDLGFERDLKAIWAYLHGMPDPGRTMDGSQPQQQQKPEPRRLPIPPTFAWPNRRQVFLCSATIHKVASLAAWVLDKPVHVSAMGLVTDNPRKMLAPSMSDAADDSGAPSLLKHQYLIVPLKLKLLALVTYLADMARGMHHSDVPRKLIVFFSTRGAVDYFHTLLARFFSKDRTDPVLGFQAGLDITKLHGSMDANERKAAIARFADAAAAANAGKGKRGSSSSKGSKGQVLITTDVAARGLDLKGVDLIIQYDAPTDVAEYVHRAGRTARAGRKGAAVLMLTPHEEEFATTMIAEKVGAMDKIDIAAKNGKLLRCPDMDAWEKAAVKQWQIPFEDWVAKDKSANTLAMLGFQAHVKGYATYPSALKPIFHVRKLHLGHLAKSFCLRNAPTELHQVLGQNQQQAANAKKKREAEADGEGGEPAKKKKKVFADGVESYAKTAQTNMNRQFASEFQTSTSAYLGGKKKRK